MFLCALGFPVHREPTVCGWSQAHRRAPFCHSPGNRLRCIWFLGRKSRVGVASPGAGELGSHLEHKAEWEEKLAPPPQVGLIIKSLLIFSFYSQESWNFSMIKTIYGLLFHRLWTVTLVFKRMTASRACAIYTLSAVVEIFVRVKHKPTLTVRGWLQVWSGCRTKQCICRYWTRNLYAIEIRARQCVCLCACTSTSLPWVFCLREVVGVGAINLIFYFN